MLTTYYLVILEIEVPIRSLFVIETTVNTTEKQRIIAISVFNCCAAAANHTFTWLTIAVREVIVVILFRRRLEDFNVWDLLSLVAHRVC